MVHSLYVISPKIVSLYKKYFRFGTCFIGNFPQLVLFNLCKTKHATATLHWLIYFPISVSRLFGKCRIRKRTIWHEIERLFVNKALLGLTKGRKSNNRGAMSGFMGDLSEKQSTALEKVLNTKYLLLKYWLSVAQPAQHQWYMHNNFMQAGT